VCVCTAVMNEIEPMFCLTWVDQEISRIQVTQNFYWRLCKAPFYEFLLFTLTDTVMGPSQMLTCFTVFTEPRD